MSGYYIGNSDINPGEYREDQPVEGDFPEGYFRVSAVVGVCYYSAGSTPARSALNRAGWGGIV